MVIGFLEWCHKILEISLSLVIYHFRYESSSRNYTHICREALYFLYFYKYVFKIFTIKYSITAQLTTTLTSSFYEPFWHEYKFKVIKKFCRIY